MNQNGEVTRCAIEYGLIDRQPFHALRRFAFVTHSGCSRRVGAVSGFIQTLMAVRYLEFSPVALVIRPWNASL